MGPFDFILKKIFNNYHLLDVYYLSDSMFKIQAYNPYFHSNSYASLFYLNYIWNIETD